MNPQSATPTSIIVHSEGFSPNNLPSLTTYVIICVYSVLTRRTVAIAGREGCSAQVTDQLNLALRAGN
jgi:sensor domain CHASE-containing protein